MRNNNNRSRPTIAIWTPTRPLLIWNPVRNHQALKTWWKPVEWMKKGARCLLGNLYILYVQRWVCQCHPDSARTYTAQFGIFVRVSPLNIFRVGSWNLSVSPLNMCRFGSWKYDHWTCVDLEVGSWKLEFVSVTQIQPDLTLPNLDFLSECHHWTNVELEVGSWNLSVSPLNICRFGSWKCDHWTCHTYILHLYLPISICVCIEMYLWEESN